MVCFLADTVGFIGALLLGKYGAGVIACLIYIFYLCCCIVLQLMFTIAHISRLQQTANPEIRTQIASTNMMTARFFTAVLLILPKYFEEVFSLNNLFVIYGILFISVGFLLLKHIHRLEK